jgi:hypothetical protein
MDTTQIVAALDKEISALQSAKKVLSSPFSKAKRVLSPKARKAIALGQKRRWAKFKAA